MTFHDEHPVSPEEKNASDSPSRLRSIVLVSASVLLAISLVAGGRAIIGVRAAAVIGPVPEAPIAVSVIPVALTQGYDRKSRHVGLVEPLRQTDVAFETSGTLLHILVGEGERIAKGQPIAQLDTRSLEAERASQVASRAALFSDLERAQLALERQRTLQARDFAAGQSFDDARLLVTRSEALIEQADATIAAIDVSLDKATLRAPFNSQVGAQTIDEGSTVNANVPVASLFEWSSPIVRIGLPIESKPALQQRTHHSIEVDGITYPATVISTRKDVSARTRTVDVRLQLDTTDRPRPSFGQTAELVLQQRIEQSGYQVPISALSEGDAGLWSLLLNVPDEPGDTTGRVVREHVEILHTDGERAFVTGDLLSEAEIIQVGHHRVVPGQRVRSKADAR